MPPPPLPERILVAESSDIAFKIYQDFVALEAQSMAALARLPRADLASLPPSWYAPYHKGSNPVDIQR